MAISDGQKFYSRWITTGVVLGVLGFLGTFLFTRVTAIPETYATKVETVAIEERIKEDVNKDLEHVQREQSSLEKLVEQGLEGIMKAQEALHEDVREIRRKMQ